MVLKYFSRLVHDETGNAFLEYALLIILMTLGVAGFVSGMGTAIGNKFGEMTTRVNQIGTP